MAADITPFIKDAQALQEKTGIPASITLAQIMLESSGNNKGGLSGLAANAKNLFGVKGVGNAGGILQTTTEVINGIPKTMMATFKKYKSYYDSMVDHANVLSLPRYQTYLKSANTIEDFAAGIQKGGYATDPQYADKLVNIIKTNNLNQYDNGKIGLKTGSSESQPAKNETDAKNGFLESVFFQSMRFGMILGLFILIVVFFLKAFPAVEDTATNVIPQTKVLKAVKKGGKK